MTTGSISVYYQSCCGQKDSEASIFVNCTLIKNSVIIKATQMGCVYVTHLRLTNSSFCLIWARVSLLKRIWWFYHKESTPKYLGWQFSESILMRRKQNDVFNVWNFRRFLFCMSSNVPTVKVRVLTSEFWMGVNGC